MNHAGRTGSRPRAAGRAGARAARRGGALALLLAGLVPAVATARPVSWPTELDRLAEVLAPPPDGSSAPRPAAAQRSAATIALRDLPPALATPAVLRALDDPAHQVRLAAIDTCAQLGVRACAERLANLARSDNSPAVRISALGTLAALDPAAAVPTLVAVVGEGAPDHRAEALRLLGEIAPALGRPASIPRAVARRVADPVAHVRAAAAAALGTASGPDAAVLLVPLLDDPAPDVQKEAALALARLDVTRIIPLLAERLRQNADRSVHWTFLTALARLSSPRAEAVLLAALDAPPENFGPVQILSILRDRPTPSPALARAVAERLAHRGSWSDTVRRAAVATLAAYGETGAHAARAVLPQAPPSVAALLRPVTAMPGVLRGARDATARKPDVLARVDLVPPPGLTHGPLRERLWAAVRPGAGAPSPRGFWAAPGAGAETAALLARTAAPASPPTRLDRRDRRRLVRLVSTGRPPPGTACLALLALARPGERPPAARTQARRRRVLLSALASPSPLVRACAAATGRLGPGARLALAADPSRAVRTMAVAAGGTQTRALVRAVHHHARATASPPVPARAPGDRARGPWLTPEPRPPPGFPAPVYGRDFRDPVASLLLDGRTASIQPSPPRPAGPLAATTDPSTARAHPALLIPLGATFVLVTPCSAAFPVPAAPAPSLDTIPVQ